MNYKKIIALAAVISMLTFSGCSSSDKAAESTDAPETTISSEETAAPADTETETEADTESETETETEAAPDTEAATEAAPTAGLTAEEAYAAKNGASWTDSIMKSMADWKKGNVVLKCSAVEDGVETAIEMSMYDSKVYMDTDVSGLMRMTMIIDKDKCYLLDIPTKSYCIETENTYDADSEVESLIDTTDDYTSFAEDGIENIDGTDYIFEKFDSEGDETVFYYSPDGRLMKMSEDETVMDFTIDLLETPDESVFEIPADFTEVSSEKMAELMMGGLLSAMEEASDEASAEE